jgi:hypothetical protein
MGTSSGLFYLLLPGCFTRSLVDAIVVVPRAGPFRFRFHETPHPR